MKRFLLILALGLMLFPSFGKKVIVIEVTKEGDGWQNLFNCYREVTTTYVGEQNGVPCATLNCLGAGYTWCRASRQIGEMSFGGRTDEVHTVLGNEQIVNAINSLIEESEKAYTARTRATSASKKVAVCSRNKTTLYYVKANWSYVTRGGQPTSKIIITVEVDDRSLLEQRL